MKVYVVMTDAAQNAVTVEADNNFKIKQYKKRGYEIIGRVKVHNGFKILGVRVK